MINRDRLDWLDSLIRAYDAEHDYETDEDIMATLECLAECRRLHDELAAALPVEQPVEMMSADERHDLDLPF